MDTEITKLMTHRLGELPQKVQELLLAPRFQSSVRVVAEKYNLQDEKRVLLENDVALVLLAFGSRSDLEENLTKELLVSSSIAANIAHDINEMIFSEVETELSEIERQWDDNEKKDADTEQQSSSKENPTLRLQKLSTQYPSQEDTHHDSEPGKAPVHEVPQNLPQLHMQEPPRAPENRWPNTIHQEHASEVKEALDSMREEPKQNGASSVPNYSKPFTNVPQQKETSRQGDTYQGKDPYHEPIE